MAKMKKKWIVLCSTAIAAVYASGYITTDLQAVQPEPARLPELALPAPVSSPGEPSLDAPATPAAPIGSATSSAAPGKYKNGTYVGSGRNRRGTLQVAVTILSDKITKVEIEHFAMHYSESDIVGLPDEVLQRQSARVANVSGATYSTQAFEDAVQDALAQAIGR